MAQDQLQDRRFMDTRKEHEFKHKLMQARNGQSPKAPNLEEA